MKTRHVAALLGGMLGAVAATPALAQSTSSDAAGAGLAIGMLVCYGLVLIVFLAFFIFWIIMLVDCIKRQENEFPGSTGNTKTIWLAVLLVGWLIGFYWVAAIAYYFMVKKKAVSSPPAAPPPPPTSTPPVV
jgi:hypothetical protein